MLEQICQLAREAGNAIMLVYEKETPVDVSRKADDSPVTAADIAAHDIILQGLKQLTPEVPVLSEEDPPSWSERQQWQRYWLVDPLDGTKEFIKRNGEFTVNIALIDQGKPVMGVVSRSHADDELKEYLQQLGEHQTVAIGSSLKFCLVAEGKAQLYPRFGPTNIWDTGAGHAVAVAAGAHVHDWQGKTLDYAPRESFLNPGFRVSLF